MSEDERTKAAQNDEATDEVEAHRSHVAATDEGGDTEGDDDFEAHRTRANHAKKV